MSRSPTETIPAVKYEVTVQENGRIDLAVPFSPGKRVVVFVVEVPNLDDTFANLTDAAQSSTDFWDNPYDVEGAALHKIPQPSRGEQHEPIKYY